jgi:elongator complex protein 2
VRQTLPGHKGLVTTVKLLKGKEGAELVSGDSSGEITFWRDNSGGQVSQVHLLVEEEMSDTQYDGSAFDAHPSSSISAIGTCPSDGSLADHLFTGASDGLVKLWKLGGQPTLVQTIDLKGKLPLDIAVANLPGTEGSY